MTRKRLVKEEESRLCAAAERGAVRERERLLALGGGHVLAIVGCGKDKQRVESPACNMYTGPLFVAAREWARRNADRWLIASARYGLVEPGDMIEPYDLCLEDLPRDRRDGWGWRCQVDLARYLNKRGRPGRVVILAGQHYVGPLLRHTALDGMNAEVPLAGLGIGARLAWFKRSRAAAAVPTLF